MFTPPCCPNRDCRQHTRPSRGFYMRHGTYRAKCRSQSVQRFLCRFCNRTFSRQTFRADYRDHRPDCNALLFSAIASGIGIRQSARILGLSQRSTELKLRKIARHLRRLNLNLRGQLGAGESFHFDEIETYEGQRNARPLSVPVLIETRSRFIVWAESATIRPRGRMTEKRRKAVERAEKRHGRRTDRSRRAIERTLRRGAEMVKEKSVVVLDTDEKSTYPRLARKAFGRRRLAHHRTNSKQVRTNWNPLFPINHEEALMRDLMGRLRRESWLASKQRRYLDLGLQVHMTYRNLVRRRFNYDDSSPAQQLGFVPRRLTPREVLSWRQDWGNRSIHPLARSGRTVAQFQQRVVAAA